MPTEPTPSPPWLALVAGTALWFVVAAAGASVGDPGPGLALVGDVGLVLLLAAAGLPRLATGAWFGLLAFQLLRLGSQAAMGEEGLLLDLLWLAGHTWVLAADLLGAWRWAVVAGALGGLAGAAALGHTLLRVASQHRRPTAAMGALLAVGALLPGLPTTWVLPALGANLQASWALWTHDEALEAEAREHPAPHPAGDGAPDVHVYVVESYGALLFRDADLADDHRAVLDGLEGRLRASGWSMASGLATAPVSGGRSWIADAAVLLGTPVAHETSYRRLMGTVDTLPHLPAWFDAAGYRTVLCRPKDRARPGVELENPLRFQETVFFADLAYAGPHVGWGWVPDQYTLGWLREEVLSGDPRPTFLFTHLVTAHVPWYRPPQVVQDWRGLGEVVATPPEAEDRGTADELAFHLHRFRRGEAGLGADLRAYMRQGDPARKYQETIGYDLEVLTRHLEALPDDRPRVVVWMGDHPPPGIASRKQFAVPVHVIASDPTLLQPFVERGFKRGLRPGRGGPVLAHEDLYEPLTEVVP